MTIREKFTSALKEALKAKDQQTLSTLRLVTAALKDKDIDARGKGRQGGIDDSEILAMLQTMVKQRRESAAIYHQNSRPELAAQEESEIAVIERYLPQQLGEEEVKAVIAGIVQKTGAAGVKDMGKVMAVLKADYAGQIDMAKAGPWVKEKLG